MIAVSKIVPLIFIAAGVFILVQISLPVLTFKIWEIGQKYSNSLLISPEPVKNRQVLGVSIKNENNFPQFVSSLQRSTKASYQTFFISISNIKINGAQVLVDSNDLASGLVHLPGSALPGEKGNVFISGHSTLPQFAGKDKSALFAKLPEVKKGDEVKITVGSSEFIYKVIEIKVVSPTDLSVIAPPNPSGRYLTLMTCVPPGLNTKRLIVVGKLQ